MHWLLMLTLMIEPAPKPGVTTRIKELASVEGVRDNQLIGYTHTGFWQPMDTAREYGMLNDAWSKGQAPWKTW